MRIAKLWSVGLVALVVSALAAAQSGEHRGPSGGSASGKGDLQVYFIDVEGGQSTLFVMPTGETLLVDTGNPGGRDAGRIVAMCKAAGVTRIDTLVITHYHTDHVGGLPEVVVQIPVGRFIDHGPNRETADIPGARTKGYDAYRRFWRMFGPWAEYEKVLTEWRMLGANTWW